MNEPMTEELDSGAEPNTNTQTPEGDDQGSSGAWYDKLNDPDLRGNATLKRFKTEEDAFKAHLELQKTLGADRVVWPKDENDTEGWAEVHKRLGVPESADEYNLGAVDTAEGLPEFDKGDFQARMKSANVPKAMAEKLWGEFTGMMNGIANTNSEQYQSQVKDAKANLMNEWGDAYDTNVRRGQSVIDNFSDNKADNDFLTQALASDPRGIAFLSKIGKQFSESSIEGFQDKKSFTLSPKEAEGELRKLKSSPDYRSDDARVRGQAVDRANDLLALVMAGRGNR